MQGKRVQLSTTWLVGSQLDSGGFGRVYLIIGNGQKAVAKFVPKAPGADRELLFANPKDVRNVVPIIDSGEHGDYWVLVMPRAEKSLRQRLNEEPPLSLAEATHIIGDICDALVDLDGKVVHRDLKPDNVLLLGGTWCLSDFGISRYAEASTAPDTRKYSKTKQYAAPEQWRLEHATTAADMYALGVTAFEMIAGHWPFSGPSPEDFREQHLHGDVPALEGVPTALATLVDECLLKAPAARPTPANFRTRLDRYQAKANAAGGGLAQLEAANHAAVKRQAAEARQQSEAMTERERRMALDASAKISLSRISAALRGALSDVLSAGSVLPIKDGGWTAKLGDAVLGFSDPDSRVDSTWSDWQSSPFDVVTAAMIRLRVSNNRLGYQGRSHSLWFGDVQQAGQYGWFESAFMISAFAGHQSPEEPFALFPEDRSVKALRPGIDQFLVAWPFSLLEADNLDEFVDRWAGWFGQAANGQLHKPMMMPERSGIGSWRQK